MTSLYLLQFACMLIMVINAFIVGFTHLYIKKENRHYRHSRYMIFTALIILAAQYLFQMTYGVRATHDNIGAIVNMLFYYPSFNIMFMAIYNLRAVTPCYKHMLRVNGVMYAVILITFGIGYSLTGGLNIGPWLYVMLALFEAGIIYNTYVTLKDRGGLRRVLNALIDKHEVSYIRYYILSAFILYVVALILPLAILSTHALLYIGPFALGAVVFFIISFVMLCNNVANHKNNHPQTEPLDTSKLSKTFPTSTPTSLSEERMTYIQSCLDQWCSDRGYKDRDASLATLSLAIDIPKAELTQFFQQSYQSSFRLWLGDIRFNAAKDMIINHPQYNNDVISHECGYTSRSYLYRVFKEREGCTPMEWQKRNEVKGVD